ncbi:MAG: hypothetical protein QNK31_11605 [Porticoccus sp.]|nr:hypothetical protein [Porticoccus sp.]
MINSVSGMSPPQVQPQQQVPLSDDQKTLISDTLANYDANNLTAEQASDIVEVFSGAGIGPSSELAETMAESGFDARTIGELAGAGQRPPPAQSSSEAVDLTELVDYLGELLEQFGGSTLDEDAKLSVYEDLRERFELDDGESLISITV